MATSGLRRTLNAVAAIPELNLAFFSFLLHFVWEMWQVPFFAGMPSTSHWAGVVTCTQATLGDASMAVVAFWAAALLRGSRRWHRSPRPRELGAYLAVGVVLTLAFEALATGPLQRWSYGPEMPRIPLLGTGLLPVLQWLIVPPLALWITRRQLHSDLEVPTGAC